MTVVWVLIIDGVCFGVFREDHTAKTAALRDHGIGTKDEWQWYDSLQQWKFRNYVIQRELVK